MWTLEETGETEEIEQLSQLSMQESITGMLLYHVGFSGIWYGWNKILSLYSLVWKETPAALATRKFFWVVTISRIPNKQAKNLASHAQILASPASRVAVKSRIPSRYLPFSRFPHCILVKSRIPRIPFQILWPVFRLYLHFSEYEMFIDKELCLYFTVFLKESSTTCFVLV